MNENIFRQKSIDKVKSPENLDDYIRVSSPGVWLLLISVIILLAGACVWGFFGHMDSTVATTVYVENGTAVCYVDTTAKTITKGMTVRFSGIEAKIADISEDKAAGYRCLLSFDNELTDGIYSGKIVVSSIKPMSFIMN